MYTTKAVEAYNILSEATEYLSAGTVNLITATVSITLPGEEYPKVVVISNPSIDPDALKDVLETIGKEADLAVAHSAHVVAAAIEAAKIRSATNGQREECQGCPDRSECMKPSENGECIVKETIH
jgi:hypothetical protein